MSLAEESLSKKLLCLDDNVGINKSHIYGMTTIFYVVHNLSNQRAHLCISNLNSGLTILLMSLMTT